MVVAAVCVPVVTSSIARAEWWQNRLRAAMGFPDIGVGHWLEWAVAAILVAARLIGGCRAMRWILRRAMRARNVTLTIVEALLPRIALLPAIAEWRRPADARADATTDSTTTRPISESLSGSAESAVERSALGAYR